MKNKIIFLIGGLLIIIVFLLSTESSFFKINNLELKSYSENEPGFDPEPEFDEIINISVGAPARYTMAELENWTRPDGPIKVGIQVGHWKNDSMPEELKNLERNTGATWNNMTESEVVLIISELLQKRLNAAGIESELLPANVPSGYIADAFLSIHADGNTDTSVNGFKFAAPRRDYAGTSQALVDSLYKSYEAETGLRNDPSITRRMTAYYAFNWPRYEHAIHPFTPAVIVETGFLTSPIDRELIVNNPDRVARGIATGVIEFLTNENLEKQPLPTRFTPAPQFPLEGVVQCAPLRTERISRADRYNCLPSIMNENDDVFLLASYSSTTAPIGSFFNAVGNYIPIQTLGTYFWFPYQVNGLIVDPNQPESDNWFLR